MIKIYHNPRCRKSRESLNLLEKSGQEFETIKYLENTPDKKTLISIIKCLGISPINLVRKNEKVWKEHYKNKTMNDNEIIEAMVQNPILIERPIIIKNNKAVIGRPAENIQQLL